MELEILSEDQIKDIHLASLTILERTGMEVLGEEAVNLLRKAGAEVTENNRVRIPPHLVEEAIQSAPSEVILCNRDGKALVSLKDRNVYFGSGSDNPHILDSFTGERRPFLKEDVANAALICDYLPNIDFVMSVGLVSDVPRGISDKHQFEAMLFNTKKPIVFTVHTKDNLADILDMAALVAGGNSRLRKNPFVVLYTEPITPLRHPQNSLEKLLLAVERGIPVVYTPAPMAGGTAPVTLAGTLALGNAELLSGLLIVQLKRKGAPFIYGGTFTVMDMSTTVFSLGAPELDLLCAAHADMAHYYKLPVFGAAGLTDAKVLDQQAGIEATMSCLLSALSGSNLVHDVGHMESGLAASYEMIVMCDEIVGMVKRVMKGISVNEETLAIDLINQVGPGGNFLAEEHTLRHFRDEQWRPQFLDRLNYDNWAKAGKLTLMDKLNKKVKNILREYSPEPLHSSLTGEIRRITNKINLAKT